MSEQSEGRISWSRSKGSRRRWSVFIAIAVCGMFLLVFVLTMTHHPDGTTDGPRTRKVTIPYGFKFFLPTPSSHISWTDISFQLSVGSNTISWMNLTAQDLTSSESNTTWHYGHPQTLGSMSVWFNVTDLAGDGRMNSGDAIAFTTGSAETFSANKTYTMTLLYEPTDGSLLGLDFTG